MAKETSLQTEMSKNLAKLLKTQAGLTVTKLAQKTGIGQPVIFRIMTGEIKSPKVSTAYEIAKYFGISINQLMGAAPLPKNHNEYTGWRSIPLLTLKEALTPALRKNSPKTIYTEMGKSERCFAIIVEGSMMEPRFPNGTTVVIDPDLAPTDNNFVVAHLPGEKQAHFKQLKLDGETKYLRSLDSKFEQIKATKAEILGVAVQAKIDLL